jgi:hypothetical protein
MAILSVCEKMKKNAYKYSEERRDNQENGPVPRAGLPFDYHGQIR